MAAADSEAPQVSGSLASHYAPVKPLRLVPPSQLEAALAARAGGRASGSPLWSVERPPQQADGGAIDWRPRAGGGEARWHATCIACCASWTRGVPT